MFDKIFVGNKQIITAFCGTRRLSLDKEKIQEGLICWIDGRDNFSSGTWVDRTGNGNNFEIRPLIYPRSISTYATSGYFNSADWGDSRPECINGSVFDGDSFSISVGVSIDADASTGVNCIFGKRGNAMDTGDGFFMTWNGRTLQLDCPLNTNRKAYFQINLQTYYVFDICVDRINQTVDFYFNGNFIRTDTWLNKPTTKTFLLSLLGDTGAGSKYLTKGRIGYCAIYNRKLSAEEVKENYLLESKIVR